MVGQLKDEIMKPWREIAIPHSDVLEGTFQQSEFAADLSAVHSGKATREYQDARAFFDRTFITEGMSLLLTSVANRLNKKGGDPVMQLQTSFGGGKTHTMLAVYHMATRTCPIQELPGVGRLLDQAKLLDVPRARAAVLDGNQWAPSQSRPKGSVVVRTLWGELAWQLGGDALYEKIRESDVQGTSPGKDLLQEVIQAAAPCVILIDELVAYIRQFEPGKSYPGGTFDSNLSFLQALTEAVKLVPDAVVLASLPESIIEAGSGHGVTVLRALEKTVGRVQALWKPVATEEAFEIVRRRLFETVTDLNARDAVCSAFADAYIAGGSSFPSETQEARYLGRLKEAYPIHPEVFDRLYEDWSTLQGFQRTRGVLKLMAKVIHQLWKDANTDLMIMPGSLPLYDGNCRSELTQHLNQGWDPVVERDIDGDRSETRDLEIRETRFGSISAARRIARTLFLGTAPSSVETKAGLKGLDRGRVLLGCLQPGQASATYVDALGRLVDRLHFLSATGDKSQENTRYWFDTRANLRREMEDRKSRYEEKKEVQERIATEVKKLATGSSVFEAVHVFAPHSDIPDDATLRLVFLPPSKLYSSQDKKLAFDAIQDYLKNNGTRPRHRANRLIFVAGDDAVYHRAVDQTRTVLAWESIVADIAGRKLVVDRLQEDQAKTALTTANGGLNGVYRECFKWLLCPVQETPTDREIKIESFTLHTSGTTFPQAVEHACIHLRGILKSLYWKGDQLSVAASRFWDDSTKYLYLPRLRNQGVLNEAILRGTSSRDFFGTALGKDGSKYEGFQFGKAVFSVDANLLLIDLAEAARYEGTIEPPAPPPPPPGPGPGPGPTPPPPPGPGPTPPPPPPTPNLPTSFHGSVQVAQAAFKMKLQDIADEILVHLAADPKAQLKITLEISAEFPGGAPQSLQRTVSENAANLGFTLKEWE